MTDLTHPRPSPPRTSGRHLRLVDREDPTLLPLPPMDRARRWLNVLVAIVGIVITLPLWLAIGIAIKLTSSGPVLYTQVRVGMNTRRSGARREDPRRHEDIGGRPFRILKFRTMYQNAEAGTGAVWAAEDDCRVTPVGRFLRAYRLDELPQLVNVLMGDMNVVGPRPERPTIFAQLREQIPEYPYRQRTAPGITGHAQINLEYDRDLDTVRQKLAYDLEYIHRASFWEDLKIMLKTIPVMLFRRGAR